MPGLEVTRTRCPATHLGTQSCLQVCIPVAGSTHMLASLCKYTPRRHRRTQTWAVIPYHSKTNSDWNKTWRLRERRKQKSRESCSERMAASRRSALSSPPTSAAESRVQRASQIGALVIYLVPSQMWSCREAPQQSLSVPLLGIKPLE